MFLDRDDSILLLDILDNNLINILLSIQVVSHVNALAPKTIQTDTVTDFFFVLELPSIFFNCSFLIRNLQAGMFWRVSE